MFARCVALWLSSFTVVHPTSRLQRYCLKIVSRKNRDHRHVLCLYRRKRNGFLRPRVKRYSGTSTHHFSTRDRYPVTSLESIVRTRV